MATNSGKDKSAPKTMDVSHPGRSMPNATSRPTIVGHRTVLKDPMMADTPSEPEEASEPVKNTGRKITPMSESAEEDKKPAAKASSGKVTVVDETSIAEKAAAITVETEEFEDTPKTKAEPAKEVEAPAEEPEKVEPEKEEPKPEASEEKTEEPEAPATDEADKPSDAPSTKAEEQKAVDKKIQEDIAKQEAIDKLIAEKTYVVPIGEKKRRRSHLMIWLLLFLVFAGGGAYAALDAQLIKNNFALPYHFFKQKTAAMVETKTLILPKSKLKFTYDPAVWTHVPSHTGDAEDVVNIFQAPKDFVGNTAALQIEEDKSTSSSIEASCSLEKTCAENYSNIQIQKIPAGGTPDLYFFSYVMKDPGFGSKPATYVPVCGVDTRATTAAYALNNNVRIPVAGQDYGTTITCTYRDSGGISPITYKTAEDAQNWIKTSNEFKLLKALATGVRY